MIIVNADGGSRGNPGPCGIGVVVSDDGGKELECYKGCVGIGTNNFAEYTALIKALELAAKYTQGEILVYMDSELVIKQAQGKYKITKDHLKKLHLIVKEKEKLFSKVDYHFVPRSNEGQVRADQLVNDALNGI